MSSPTSPGRPRPARQAGGYREVLSNRRYLALWLAQAGADLGDAVARMAIIIFVTEKTKDPLAVSTVFAIQLLPMVLFAPFTGVLVDRWDKKKVMVLADLVRSVLLLAAAAATSLGQIYALSFLVVLAGQFFNPARATAVPEVVGREHYMSAVALSQMTFQLVQLVGPALGGALAGTLGTRAAFLLNAATFLLSAAIIWSVRFPPLPVKRERTTLAAVGSDFREGLSFLWGTPALRFLVVSFGVIVLGIGFFNVLYVDYTRNVLGATPGQFGLLESLWAAGTIVGVAVVGQVAAALPKGKAIFGSIGVVGLLMSAFFFRPGLVGVGVLGTLAGFATAFLNVPANTLLILLTPVEKRGRVTGVVNSLVNVSSLVGLAGSGAVAAAVGSAVGLGLAGLFVAAVAVVAVLLPGFRELEAVDRRLREETLTGPVRG
ncbi:MAG: MFS transporter [Firmicutes bacterium]|nr:MFS transporter [Bacillota bacterium]